MTSTEQPHTRYSGPRQRVIIWALQRLQATSYDRGVDLIGIMHDAYEHSGELPRYLLAWGNKIHDYRAWQLSIQRLAKRGELHRQRDPNRPGRPFVYWLPRP